MIQAVKVSLEVLNDRLDPYDHLEEILDKINRWEPKVNAYAYVENMGKLKEDLGRQLKRKGRLSGVIVAVKDNISTSWMPTTAASRMLSGYIPPYNATVIEKLLYEGAVIIGKTNMDEFAMGSTSENTPYGPVHNPWCLDCTAGGSSGGSGAVLAYGGADLALGSDTGGSVRLPAAYTGTVALKPTYGTVSRYGLIPYANSLEQISPMARTVKDLALLYNTIKGDDPRDSTTLGVEQEYPIDRVDPGKTRIAVIRELMDGVDEGILKIFWNTISLLESHGFTIDMVSIKSLRYSLPAYYVIAMAEASSNLARYDGVIHGNRVKECRGYWDCAAKARGEYFGVEVKTRILMGAYVLMEGYSREYYVKATKLRRLIRDSLAKLFKDYQAIISPVSPILPPKLGEKLEDPVKMYTMDVMTVTANLAGIPALVQPAGIISGFPIGIQWMGPVFSESRLFGLASIVEDEVGVITPLQ
ncbi:MAG: Asp-tRNA(Asn)/Glu-tRNA(Gln) amidotransferase subunit GatA [Desulfurococcales archaeon]|nr:Asp-tRNA(Asn)/Glu-tRNA(Gln) amidotransferase subunit GatA [Desulfurococcales archaeon]